MDTLVNDLKNLKEEETMENSKKKNVETREEHSNISVVLFLIGLAAFIFAIFIPEGSIKNLLSVFTILTSGYHIVLDGIKETVTESIEKKRFQPNVHLLMALATIGACILGNYREGALLIVIFAGAHFLEEYVEGKSKREITNLLKMNPTEARLIKSDGSVETVDVSILKVGDKVKVLNGDQIPTDGVITLGVTSIDESSINGESMPADKTVGDYVFGSTINGNGTIEVEVTKASTDTVFAKIMQLVDQSQSNLSKRATKIKQFEPTYVTVALVAVTLYIVLAPIIFSVSLNYSFYKGMVFLVAASPCALAASAIPATLSGISNLAKKGVLFKGGSFLASLVDLKAIAFDKTGTLTEGKPKVTNVYFVDEIKSDYYTNIVVAMEKLANHPLADAIVNYLKPTEALDLEIDNQIGKGLVTSYNGNNYLIGKPSIFSNVSTNIDQLKENYASEGKTVVYIAENDTVIGMIAMMDIPNEYSKEVISYFQSQGVITAMITGDAKTTGEAVGKSLGMDRVFANVLPENKSEIVESLMINEGATAMVGDGVNDAPALVKADVGIAMGDGTDIAIDVADVVLMQNDLTKLSYAHKVSKKLDKLITQNIAFSMLVVAFLVMMNIFNFMSLPLGIVIHEGSTLIVLINSIRLLKNVS